MNSLIQPARVEHHPKAKVLANEVKTKLIQNKLINNPIHKNIVKYITHSYIAHKLPQTTASR